MKLGKKTAKLVVAFRVDDGKSFRLKDFDPTDRNGLESKQECAELLQHNFTQLTDLQDKLYAQDQWAVLLIFQAMDAAGKDGVIKHVFSGVNPQGCEVSSFKQPSGQELNHDFLCQTTTRSPQPTPNAILN